MSADRLSRRELFRRTGAVVGAAAGARLLGGPLVLAGESPNRSLGTAVIGAGGRGNAHLGAAASEHLVALVDVDENRLAKAGKKVAEKAPKVKTYSDYRRMFDEVGGDVDAVFIATPDHTHAHPALMALERDIAVYVEKPMTRTIHEARVLTEAAREKGVASQLGNQGHSGEGYRRLCEYIWAGAVGPVREVIHWADRNFGGAGGRPEGKPAPEHLHWDQWIGPAPHRDYHGGLHPFSWRSWWDFGTGSIGDMGCHIMDGAFWALKLKEAERFSVELVEHNAGSEEKYPVDNLIRWKFPARGEMPPVTIRWYDGVGKEDRPEPIARVEEEYGRNFGGCGTLYVGDEGLMYTGTYGGGVRIIPEEKHRAFPPPERTIPRVKGGHQGDFLRACRGDEPSSAHFDYSGPLTEMILTSQLAMKAPGEKVEWNVGEARCSNPPRLNRYVSREYRDGWSL
ncbi:MAG: Gfo/Idh/MocA family protein [Planctomycetota bacterium]